MAELTVVFWRDIPAQVIARAGRKTAKAELPKRFMEAIDSAAVADKVATIELTYDADRLRSMIENSGSEAPRP
jgi:hypothetical protein